MNDLMVHRPLTGRMRATTVSPTSGFRLILWGIVVYWIAIRLDGFDLLPDIVGCALIIVGTYRVQQFAPGPFSRARWCVVVLALFAVARVAPANTTAAPVSIDDGPRFITWEPFSLFVVAETMTVVVAGWWLMAGITEAARNQHQTSLAQRGVGLQLHQAVTVSVLVVLSFWGYVFLGSTAPVALLGTAGMLWITVRLLLLLRAARHQLVPAHGSHQTTPPASTLERVGLAAMITVALLSWSIRPAPVLHEPAAPAAPSMYDRAVANQPPGLIVAPDALVPAVIDHDGPYGCTTEPWTLSAVDPATGIAAWQHPVPASTFLPVVQGDAVFLANEWLDYERLALPRVARIDLADGNIRWLRVLDGARVVALDPVPEGGVAVEAIDHASGYWWSSTLSADGALADPAPTSRLGSSDDHRSTPGPDDTLAMVEADTLRLRLEGPDGSVVVGDTIPFDETFTSLGNPTSPGDPIQVGRDHVLVALGSLVGPNSRIAVYDARSATLRWTLDHVRSAAMGRLPAGPSDAGTEVIVYDKRNTEPPNARSTRDLFVVSADDPEQVLWTAPLSVNEVGGNGYLGSTAEGLVFALDTGAGEIELLTVAGPGTQAPAVIRAAEGVGGGPSPMRHAGPTPDGLVAMADGTTLVIHTRGETRRFGQDAPIRSITPAGQRLLVVTGPDTWRC